MSDLEHGPEWWAMGAEVCKCGHRADEHIESVSGRWPCGTGCDCADYNPTLDNQQLSGPIMPGMGDCE